MDRLYIATEQPEFIKVYLDTEAQKKAWAEDMLNTIRSWGMDLARASDFGAPHEFIKLDPAAKQEAKGPELVGKRMERDTMEVEVPDGIYRGDERKKAAEDAVLAALPDGWELFDSFSSQGSFFRRDGRQFARANIRRWVDINEQENKS